MHRSGSSFAASLLQRLGMSLGPFELLGASEANSHGYFEAVPFVTLNREVQTQAFGFSEDFPTCPDLMRHFLAGGGKWPSGRAFTARQRQQGRRLIEQLVASGRVCGFKDPRTVLTWPFWESVLEGFPGLRVVALSLLRSPHEIAMSMFQRSRGACSYNDALAITAVHYRRMKEILDRWRGDRAVLHFEPQTFAREAPRAAETCGLPWDEMALAEVYDPQCRHHAPVRVAHEAQTLYDQLGAEHGAGSGERGVPRTRALGAVPVPCSLLPAPCYVLPDPSSERDNLGKLMADAAIREETLHRERATLAAECDKTRALLVRHVHLMRAKVHRLECNLRALQAEKATWDEYRRTRGWAVLLAVWRIKRALLSPRRRMMDAASPRLGLISGLWRRLRGTTRHSGNTCLGRVPAQDAAPPATATSQKNSVFFWRVGWKKVASVVTGLRKLPNGRITARRKATGETSDQRPTSFQA